jgi:DsbC/DsbD-like thiol-disulfide interchange protein
MKSVIIPLYVLIICLAPACYGQQPVVWQFEAGTLKGDEATLFISADLAPGWHLYSQRIKKGGPIPTRFTFDSEPDYAPAGVTEESGTADVFFDDIYDMEIIWYTGEVQFSQRFKVRRPDVTIQGKVEYMTCNNQICIPGVQKFSVGIYP